MTIRHFYSITTVVTYISELQLVALNPCALPDELPCLSTGGLSIVCDDDLVSSNTGFANRSSLRT